MNKNIKIIEDLGLIYITKNSKIKRRYLIIECVECSKHIRARNDNITYGNHSGLCSSCSNTTHGKRQSRLYNMWANMKQRCYSENTKSFVYYGGKGISMYELWRNDFGAFYDWAINNGYDKKLTIDREDNDGNYNPLNCRFTTHTVQNRNTRRIRRNNTSGYRGVSRKIKGRWVARICVNSNPKHLGYFDTSREAAIAYDSYVKLNNLEHTCNFQ